jgi:hypothetical protein
MIGFRSLSALFIVASLLTPPARSETDRRFRMYRNPPKPRLVVLPVASRLDPPAKSRFDQALTKEARKRKGFRVLNPPKGMVIDSLGQLPPGSLALLREKHGVDLILQTMIEPGPGRNVLYAEVIDTRDGGTRADFRQECACTLDELISGKLPEALNRLTGSPRLRAMRCQEGMAGLPAPAPPGSQKQDSAGEARDPGAFCMDRYEFPNRPSGEPLVEKTWEEAEALCAKEGKRLCSEAEWELACGGLQAQAFPYVGGYLASQCNTQSLTIQLSGSNAGCRSPFGVIDLSGNVYEWTSTPWGAKYRDKVVKGGNWNAGAENSSCKARFGQPPASISRAIGFRCCLTLDP